MSVFIDDDGAADVHRWAQTTRPVSPFDFSPGILQGTWRGLSSVLPSLKARAEYGVSEVIGTALQPGAERLDAMLGTTTAQMVEAARFSARESARQSVPRPWELGTVGGTIHDFAVAATELIVPTVATGGFVGPFAGYGYATWTQGLMEEMRLVDRGVDPTTAARTAFTGIGIGNIGALMTGSFSKLVPSLGPWEKYAFEAVAQEGVNVNMGFAQRGAEAKFLRDAGHVKLADEMAVTGLAEIGFDAALALVTSPFGVAGKARSPGDRTLPATETADRVVSHLNVAHAAHDTMPGVPLSPHDAEAHIEAMIEASNNLMNGEPVAVQDKLAGAKFADPPPAMQRQQEQNEQAMLDGINEVLDEAATVRADALGAPPAPKFDIAIKPGKNLTPADRGIEARLAKRVRENFDGLVDEYGALPDAEGGKVLNTDVARELSPDYLTDRTKSAAVHEPASAFIKELYRRKLAEAPKPGERPMVMFTAGGTGAGKTSGIKGVAELQQLKDAAQIVYDTNMNGYDGAVEKIDDALAAGKEVVVAFVYRDPVDALTGGALPRAMGQERKFGSGRTVPLGKHEETHTGSRETVLRLAEKYQDNPLVKFSVVDNSGGKGKQRAVDLAFLAAQADNTGTLRGRLRDALEDARRKEEVSEAVYRGFAAGEPERAAAGQAGPVDDAAGNARGSLGGRDRVESARANEGRSLTEAVYGNAGEVLVGDKYVPVKWALVESDALAPSVQKSESQARDRTRAASDQQVATIAAGLDFRRLGDSPEMGVGAPTLSNKGAVIGGNARTLAIRRAYDQGTADNYRQSLEINAERYGFEPEAVAGMKAPALVRVLTDDVDVRAAAIASNEGGGLRMSLLEQAPVDAGRLPPLAGFHVPEDGNLNAAGNSDYVMAWVRQFPGTEQAALVDAAGKLSQEGLIRMRNAILFRAYGESATLARLVESTDPGAKNLSNALTRAGPPVAHARDAIAAGDLHPLDLTPDVIAASEKLVQLRGEGTRVADFVAQVELVESLTPVGRRLLSYFDAHARSARRMADVIAAYYSRLEGVGNPKVADMFGGGVPDRAHLLDQAIRDVEDPEAPTLSLFADKPDPFPGTAAAPRSSEQLLYKANARVDDAEGEAPRALDAAVRCEAA